MGREIKFRAWDNKYKVMFGVGGLTNLDYRDDDNMKYAVVDGASVGVKGGATHEWENIELMQYTGLHDKNGKEIYEGDIVKSHIGIGQIVFSKYITDNETNEDILGWCLMTSERYYALDPQSNHEVIGNIYQNGDLLK